MKFTYNWLCDHLDTKHTPQEIAERLTQIGLELESFINPKESLQGLRVSEIREAEKHPNADRLKVCKVYDGQETLQVVCGAPNARAGIKVVLAYPGTVIPISGIVLSKGNIRGVESMGMMCSTRELCLGEDHEGIIELPQNAPVGEDFVTVMGLDDPVFEIAVTPNRGDCLGVRGVARDLAAAGMGKLKPFSWKPIDARFQTDLRIIRNCEPQLCPIFAGRVFRNIKNGQSPQWMQNRLRAVGASIISALVDISNYVLFDLGRPNHVFNMKSIQGNLQIRHAAENEKFLALKGIEYTLDPSMIVIADDKQALSLAGIKGGQLSGCYDDTTEILFESAVFDPLTIAHTGRMLNLSSDARARFERGVDAGMVIPALDYATQLILDICGGDSSQVVVSGELAQQPKVVSLPKNRVHALTGMSISDEATSQILDKLGFSPIDQKGSFDCTVPSWRHDIEREQDLIEEIARIHGYDNLPLENLPQKVYPQTTTSKLYGADMFSLKKVALGLGYDELYTWSFISPLHAQQFGGDQESLRLINPISSELAYMRGTLIPNLLVAIQKNRNRGYASQAFFEAGSRFRGILPDEQDIVISGVCIGDLKTSDWQNPKPEKADVFSAKSDLSAILNAWGLDLNKLIISTQVPGYYHPGRGGAVHLGPKMIIGYFGELHPHISKSFDIKDRVAIFELNVSRLPAKKSAPKEIHFSDYQAVERDFAFVFDQNIQAGSVVQSIQKLDKNLIQEVKIFDVYQGEKLAQEQKSLAFRVKMQAQDHTLGDQELQSLSNAIIKTVQELYKGQLRQ